MGLSDLVSGAAGGAMAGGALGGPWGALGGGVIGGALGLFGGNKQDDQNKRLKEIEAQVAHRQLAQTGPAAQAQHSQFRGNQQNLIGRLEALSAGQGPSLAQAQMQAATDRNVKMQQSLAAGARGPNAALAQFQAANNAASLGAQATQDAAAARIAEQQMALQQLGLTVHGARGNDEELARFNAAQTNDTRLANLQAQTQQQQISDQMRLRLLEMQNGMAAGPSLGQSILAGGATMFAQGATATPGK